MSSSLPLHMVRMLTPAERVMHNFTRENDYRDVYLPFHPRAHKSGWIREHRVIAERKLGRFLEPTEIVHHINGDPFDNRPENLHVCKDNAEHRRLHRKVAA